jgi:hypothetical protein
MTSTTVNNNSTSSSQPTQHPFLGTNSGSALVASLVNAKEPSASSSNQQQTQVSTFREKTAGGTSTVCFRLSLFSTSIALT